LFHLPSLVKREVRQLYKYIGEQNAVKTSIDHNHPIMRSIFFHTYLTILNQTSLFLPTNPFFGVNPSPGCGDFRSGQRLIMISRNDEHRPLARFGATVAMAPDCSAAPGPREAMEVEKTHGFSTSAGYFVFFVGSCTRGLELMDNEVGVDDG
jgi:hypothetical protein